MAVVIAAGIIIALLLTTAIVLQVSVARAEHRGVMDHREEHAWDYDDGLPHLMGREEQGADAVLRQRVARGEISAETYRHLMHEQPHQEQPPAA